MSDPTVAWLLSRPELRLRAVVAGDAAAAIRWVHSSDLLDPTPFLAPDMVLLTTGTQFEAATDVPAYVARLREHGVVALGFGTEVVRQGIPPALASTCDDQHLMLFEVPYRTPFIAVARAVADAISEQQYARRTWALGAQRAVATAALRTDGLGAIVSELARELGTWVGLLDEAGEPVRTSSRLPSAASTHLSAQASRMIERRRSAATTTKVGGASFLLQTLGHGSDLRGVLAVADVALDGEARGVVTTVVAMAGFALAQNEALATERGALRAGVLRALNDGHPRLAESIAAGWEGLPAEPRVAVTDRVPDALPAFLELAARRDRSRLFFGASPDGDGLVLLSPSDQLLQDVAERFGVHIGVSDAAPLADFPARLRQAQEACRQGDGVTRFADLDQSAATTLAGPDAVASARALLTPLVAHDAAAGTAILPTVRAWLENDANIERTAGGLGVHRHTVRARIHQADQLLAADLTTFAGRARVWLALRLIDARGVRSAVSTIP
ncbi:MAG: PucR family transcriptional regulator [Microbacterium sp.]